MPPVTASSRLISRPGRAASPTRPVAAFASESTPATPLSATVNDILQRYDQGRTGLEETVLALFHGGVSPAQAELAACRLFGADSGLPELAARARTVAREITAWTQRALARPRTSLFLQAVTFTQKPPSGPRETTVQIAVGVDARGGLEVLGVAAVPPGAEPWTGLLAGLRRRGLPAAEIVVGGSEPDLPRAVHRHFPGARFQVCLGTLEEQLLYKVPPALVHVVADGFASLRAATAAAAARAARSALTLRLRTHGQTEVAAWLENTDDVLFSHLAFPPGQQAHLRDARFLRKPLGQVRARVRLLGPELDDTTLMLLVAARLRQTWPAHAQRRFKTLARRAG
ncbi:hypothetical protein ESB00_19275 [Oleiharenicola lentus]|uniref:Mutator family transposase n=1 Tax=Oleiharenicola lentus TaxID=2508720 RepID=A0A4Q1C618_9BACT|nr:transposase [Oleiharenicola lentus]RXK53825.1 hypothetical protein ESB00_19275 [Oleiharenicola lentus]